MDILKKLASADQWERKHHLLRLLNEGEIPYEIHDTEENGASVSNVVVSHHPTSHRLVIGAHWDSVEGSTGANDDGSSCAILYRLCMLLKQTELSVDLVFFDKEEVGCLGSRAYIREIGRDNISAMVNLDMCGAGRCFTIAHKGNRENPDFYGILTDGNLEKHGVCSLDWLPNGDDSTFTQAGIPNISVCILTERDCDVFRVISGRIAAGETLTDEDKQAFGTMDVMKTMHNGENDSIAAVTQEAMDAVYSFIADGLNVHP